MREAVVDDHSSLTRRPTALLVDRYEPVHLCQRVPHWHLAREPELAPLDKLLEDDVLVQRVTTDLIRRYPHSAHQGRHAPPGAVILRMRVVQPL